MRILLIEDEKKVAGFVKRAIAEDMHSVDIVGDGVKGEKMARSQAYDLLILDIMLPHKDGVAILKSLRETGHETPVLMLTALGEVQDRVDGLNAGADDYLPKPFAVAELRARVRSLLRRQPYTTPNKLTIGEISIDTVLHQVKVDKEIIELTNREYAVLECLMRNSTRILTKGMIAEHVWNFQSSSYRNLIEVYICHLRQKLGSEGRLIKTVRNGGYTIRESRA